jgi:hypothetical protein
MNWYVVKLVFRITPGEGRTAGQFDEHLRLIRAESLEQAYGKAKLLGIREESTSEGSGPANREFVNIAELHLLQDLCDGTEVYSRVHEVSVPGDYVQWIHQQAATLVN